MQHRSTRRFAMAGYKSRGSKKSGGLTGNLVKIGGGSRKLSLRGDYKSGPMMATKKGAKQAHKRA
jgi:hypothetical protein